MAMKHKAVIRNHITLAEFGQQGGFWGQGKGGGRAVPGAGVEPGSGLMA